MASDTAKPVGGKKFRFIYTSGYLTERNQNQNLWFAGDFRKLRVCSATLIYSSGMYADWSSNPQGDVENKLIDFEEKHPYTFETIITKPGAVLGKGNPVPQMLYGVAKAIKVDTLAAAMIDLAISGGKGKQTMENADLEERAKAAL